MTTETVWEGKYLAAMKKDGWEWAERKGRIGAAVIVAVHDEQLILVEQFRIPIDQRCLELPAGLVGDDAAGESLEDAAIRELEEETGYRAGAIEKLGDYYASPGMTSEAFSLVRATDLTRVGEGGGEENEDITVHHVPVGELEHFVADKRAAGVAIDGKLLALLGPRL
mgnify:CR=1 FL=1